MTAYSYCSICDNWVLLSPNHRELSEDRKGIMVIDGQIAHNIVTSKQILQRRMKTNPPPDVVRQVEPTFVKLVQPVQETPEPEPVQEQEAESDFQNDYFRVVILKQVGNGLVGELDSKQRAYVPSTVADPQDYPPGTTMLAKLKQADPSAFYDFVVWSVWGETPNLNAKLIDVIKAHSAGSN